MSGLAAVLAGKHEPGVNRWESGLSVDTIAHAVEHAGWFFGYVDGAGLSGKDDTIRAIGIALGFPEAYGTNLDSLNDGLRDLSGPTILLWDAWGGFARADQAAFLKVVEVLGDRDPKGAPVEVLLRGPGPDGLVALLD